MRSIYRTFDILRMYLCIVIITHSFVDILDVTFDVPRDHNQLAMNEQQSDETITLNSTTARTTPNG